MPVGQMPVGQMSTKKFLSDK
jgi:hypothetical protein